jgi:Zn-dependent protease
MRFRVGSIPVDVQPSFFLACAFLAMRRSLTDIAIWVAVCFVSVLIHELGHALAIARFGGEPSVLLYQGGGLTFGDQSDTPWRSIAVSVAGPAAGFLLAGVVFLLARSHPPQGLAQQVHADLIYANVWWGLFNLLPMLPLDGGNAFESLLELRWPARARFWAELMSVLTCTAVAGAALFYGYMLLVVMVGFWVAPVWKSLYLRFLHHRDRDMARQFEQLYRLRRAGSTDQALVLAERLLPEARTSIYRRAVAAEQVMLQLDLRAPHQAISALIQQHFRGAEVPPALWLAQIVSRDGARRTVERLQQEAQEHESLEVLGLFFDACAELDDRERGAAFIATLPDVRLADSALLVRTAVNFYQRRYEWTLTLCEIGLTALDRSAYAYNAACCLAQLNRLDEAFEALSRAVHMDGAHGHDIDADPDLEAMRTDERWQTFRASVVPPEALPLPV